MHQKKLFSLLTAGLLFAASCPQLFASAAESGASDFVIENGVLLEYTGDDKVVFVPEGVTEIGFQAFARLRKVQRKDDPEVSLNIVYNNLVEEVYLPESLLLIDERAFFGCVSLKTVHFQEGLLSIETHAFAGNSELHYEDFGLTSADMQMHLESVKLPDSLQTIGEFAFHNSGLQAVQFGDGLEEIGADAFSYTDLKTVTLPDSLKYFSEFAFAYTALETVQLPKGLEQIPESAFAYSKLKTVTIPETVHTIGYGAFQGTALTGVTIPAEVETIGSFAFAESALRSVTYEGTVTNMGKDVFSQTPYARSVTETVDDLEIQNGNLVRYNGNDVTVRIPDSVVVIAEEAFQGASRLRYLYLPDSVRQISKSAFANCSHLREVHFGSGLKMIGDEAFLNCKKLRLIALPDSVQSIGNSVFENCTVLEDVRLNDGLESAGYSCFDGCSALKTLRIPASLKKLTRTFYLHDMDNDTWLNLGVTVASYYREHPEILAGVNSEIIECSLLGPHFADNDLYGESDSLAPGIAQELHLAWKPLSELPPFDPVPDGPDMSLDFGKDTWKFLNAGSVFGSERYMTEEALALAKQTVNGDLASLDSVFDGSCYGMSLTVILAKAGKLNASDMFAGASSLGELEPDQTVQSVINFYHYMQYAQKLTVSAGSNAEDQLAEMIETAEDIPHGALPMLLTLNTTSGNHAVVGCGLEKGTWVWDGRAYDRRVLIWDPNNPNELKDEACFYINTVTFDYCVPLYGVIYETDEFGLKQGALGSCSNDLNRLLPAEYPFPAQVSGKRGDLNCDGKTDVSDAVLFARFLAEDRVAVITDQGIKNAETDGEAGLTMSDLTVILKIIAKIIQ